MTRPANMVQFQIFEDQSHRTIFALTSSGRLYRGIMRIYEPIEWFEMERPVENSPPVVPADKLWRAFGERSET